MVEQADIWLGILGSAVIGGMTLGMAYVLRRIHELGDRMLAMEMRFSRFKPIEDLLDVAGGKALKGGLRRR